MFNIMAKLSPRYIRTYEIIEKLNHVAYKLDLPAELEYVHNVIHTSHLRKYAPDPNHVIIIEPVQVAKNLVYK